MLFKQKQLEKILSGDISLAFRRWKRPAVQKGSLIHTGIGLIKIEDIASCELKDIGNPEARLAGYDDLAALKKELNKRTEGLIYRIRLSFYSEDPRIALRTKTSLSEEDWEILKAKLTRLDKYSKEGKWTIEILRAIQSNPLLKARHLALKTGRDKEWLKLNIRKLKNLGLTISHTEGYSISPLGLYALHKLLENR